MDSREQVLTHEAGVKVPIELQNMSVAVRRSQQILSISLSQQFVQFEQMLALRYVLDQLDGAWMPQTVALVVINQTDSKFLP